MRVSGARTASWSGLGLWNVFFIGEFLLAGFGYLHLNLLQLSLIHI